MPSIMEHMSRAPKIEMKKGKGKGAAIAPADATDHQVLRQLVPILVNLDRECAALRDRSGFVVIITSEEFKDAISQARAQWKSLEEQRSEKWAS